MRNLVVAATEPAQRMQVHSAPARLRRRDLEGRVN